MTVYIGCKNQYQKKIRGIFYNYYCLNIFSFFHFSERGCPEKGPPLPDFLVTCFDSSVHSLFTLAAALFLLSSAEENISSQNVRGACRVSALKTAQRYPYLQQSQGHGVTEWVTPHCL